MSFNTRTRAHKSTKVPGVKLKPKATRQRPLDDEYGIEGLRADVNGDDTEEEEDSDGNGESNGSLPLTGYNFTFTGIPDQKVRTPS